VVSVEEIGTVWGWEEETKIRRGKEEKRRREEIREEKRKWKREIKIKIST
jgi:hypothetical protein